MNTVTRKWNTSHYTRTMGEIHKQSNDFLNGYTKLATKIKHTHTIVGAQPISIKDTYLCIQRHNILLQLKRFFQQPATETQTPPQTNQH